MRGEDVRAAQDEAVRERLADRACRRRQAPRASRQRVVVGSEQRDAGYSADEQQDERPSTRNTWPQQPGQDGDSTHHAGEVAGRNGPAEQEAHGERHPRSGAILREATYAAVSSRSPQSV